MILFLRKILLYLFIGIYLVCCPMIILYALGYSFKPDSSDTGIVKTGLIYLSTAPSQGNIFIGNRRYAKKTPAVIRDLLPGNYPIRIEAKNHKSWDQIVSVEEEKASVLERILLLPDPLEIKTLVTQNFKDLVPIPETDFILLSQGSKLSQHFFFDIKDKKIMPFPISNPALQNADIAKFFIIKQSSALIVKLAYQEKAYYFWLDLKDSKKQAKDISSFFPLDPERISWNPHQKNTLYTYRAHAISRLDIESGSFYPEIVKGVQGFGVIRGLFRTTLYVLSLEHHLGKYDAQGHLEEWILNDKKLIEQIFGSDHFYHIDLSPNNLITFLSETGRLLTNKLPYEFLDKDTREINFDSDSKRLLVWQKNRIGFLNPSKDSDDSGSFELAPELEWKYESGSDIHQVFMAYKGSYLIFEDGNSVFILETESYGSPRLEKILKTAPDSNIYYSEDTGYIYFLNEPSGFLEACEIVPNKELSIPSFSDMKENITIKKKKPKNR